MDLTAMRQDAPRIIGYTPGGRPVFPVAGGQGDPPGDPPGDPKPDPPSGGDPPPDEFKPITSQEEFDRMVKARIARERQKYADYPDLKSKAAEFDKLQDTQKTELQKAAEARAAAERDRELARLDLQNERIKTAIYGSAASVGIAPEAAFRLADHSSIDFDDDGVPTSDSVETEVKKVLEQYPQLATARRPQGSGDGGPRGGSPDKKPDMEELLRAAVKGKD